MPNPSGSMMNRLVPCHGSFKLCTDFPETQVGNSDADKGTTAHWLAAKCMKLNMKPHFWLGKNPVNDQIVDIEMIEHVSGYIDYIESFKGISLIPTIETKLTVDGFEGTPDFLKYDVANKKVTILDLKYGFSVVEVFENWQLISYFWLWWMNNKKSLVDHVDFIIYQPRPYHPNGSLRKWSIDVDSLIDDYFFLIDETLVKIYAPKAITSAGIHCLYCSAMLYCRANLETCLNFITVTGFPNVDEPDNWMLGKQLEMFQYAQEILKQRVTILETIAETRLKQGEVIPGYGMVSSGGHRSWKISDEKAKSLGIPYEKPKIVSPRQAELAGVSKSLVKANVITKTKMKFVKVNTELRAMQLFGYSEE